jgi:hypothetical protein
MQADKLAATFAVGVVAAAALIAVLMARPDAPAPAPVVEQADAVSASQQGVVKAPPLTPKKPAFATQAAPGADARANAMGAAPACRNCGVVQMVVAVHGYAQPQASGYQMHIRMDDGSMRMVQQRGALAAGSRVLVEGDSVRVLAQRSGQG